MKCGETAGGTAAGLSALLNAKLVNVLTIFLNLWNFNNL
jgi:hypothetical protein